ncbi:DUF4180 domain-containing protein [Svornostia abyssi]|uniref:DUF4180 domain-containing protein n=1 Tax=Svornostia abyssi TaxID=2898438 RepID=A0ABY5PIF8_9ACTN|nr:DUF4180 domain-containing protein [Parviterribacteraceae bacterium J379]
MSASVFHVPADGPATGSTADALGLLYADGAEEADWIAVPVARLDPAFFDLRSGLAGEVVQTLANYRVGLALVGDVTEHVAGSRALGDFVRESNRGRQLWFVTDEAELRARLGLGAVEG